MRQFEPKGLLSYFTRHRTAANLLLVVVIAAGVAAFPRMRAQFFPDVVIESVNVSLQWSGAGAEDVDLAIVQLLEPALLAVEGVAASWSTSREGRASISVEFEPGWNMDRAEDDIQAAVDGVANLPSEAEDAQVRRGAWRDPVTDVVITGPVGLDQIARFADELIAELFSIGVTRASVSGLAAPETAVIVTQFALVAHDVSLADIAAAIRAEAAADPAGDIGSGTARIRAGVQKRSAPDIQAIVLRSNDDGSSLTIGDVATIQVRGIDRERAYFVGDDPAISIRVIRSDRGDAIDIQNKVQSVVDELQPTLPQGVRLDLIRTRAEAITGRLDILYSNGLMGLGLVLALLFLFLNARTAFWVAAGIPVAMLATIAIMYLAGLTFNMISLFALLITLGIVVDDAIIVGEHADFRVRRYGESPVVAAENAARRMFAPVFSATLTTIIAFFGLVAIGGRFGSLIADIPFTVIVVLSASLIECFLILPNHMSHAIAHSAKEHWYDLPSRVVNYFFRLFRHYIFRNVLRLVIWARYPVMAAALLLLATQTSTFIRGDLPFRFFNAPEQGSVSGNFAMLPGATRADSLAMMQELQRAANAVGQRLADEHGANPVEYVLTQIGGASGFRGLSGADTKESWQLGGISIELIPADERPYSSFAFVADLQDEVRNHPMAETVSFRGFRGGPGGDALDIELFGSDADTLKSAAEALKTELALFSEVSALEDNLAYDKDELILELTPQGQALGLTIDGLGSELRDRLSGIEAASYPDGTRSATIRVEVPENELVSDFLDRTLIRTGSGNYVHLADVVSVTTRTGFSTVRRQNGIRLINVTGDLSEDDPERAEAVMDSLAQAILPDIEERFGVASRLSGLAEQERNFLNDALTGFILCLLGIFLTLAWIFASWTRPLVVMLIIPFGLIGAIWGHVYWEVPLSMFSVVGLIGMTGIIINDSIVLISTIDEYTENRGLVPAIIDGACDRLRPVFLTTASTVLGLTPLLFERSRDAQFLKPTIITLVYGLGFGMLLVLILVPAVLASGQDMGRFIVALRRSVSRRSVWALRVPVVIAGGLSAAIFAATLGFFALWQTLPVLLIDLLAQWGIEPGLTVALALFVAGTAVSLIIVHLSAVLAITLRRSVGLRRGDPA